MPLSCTLVIVKGYILCHTHVATIRRLYAQLYSVRSALKRSRSSDGLTVQERLREKGKGEGEKTAQCASCLHCLKYLNSCCEPITVLTIEFRDSAGLRALILESVHRDRRLLLKVGESKDHFYPLPRAHYTSSPTGTLSLITAALR